MIRYTLDRRQCSWSVSTKHQEAGCSWQDQIQGNPIEYWCSITSKWVPRTPRFKACSPTVQQASKMDSNKMFYSMSLLLHHWSGRCGLWKLRTQMQLMCPFSGLLRLLLWMICSWKGQMSLASQFLLLAQSLPFITNTTRSSSPMRCTLLLLHWIHVCFSMLTKASFLMPTLHGRIPTFCLLKKTTDNHHSGGAPGIKWGANYVPPTAAI